MRDTAGHRHVHDDEEEALRNAVMTNNAGFGTVVDSTQQSTAQSFHKSNFQTNSFQTFGHIPRRF